MNRKKASLEHVGDILNQSMKNINAEEKFRVFPIWKNWETIVGPVIAAKTHPDFIQGQCIIISVENTTWMNELALQKNRLLKKINDFSKHPIQDIKFRLKK